MNIDLDDDERRILIDLLTVEINKSSFPLSERIARLKRVRVKLVGVAERPGPAEGGKAPAGVPKPKSKQ